MQPVEERGENGSNKDRKSENTRREGGEDVLVREGRGRLVRNEADACAGCILQEHVSAAQPRLQAGRQEPSDGGGHQFTHLGAAGTGRTDGGEDDEKFGRLVVGCVRRSEERVCQRDGVTEYTGAC